MVVGLSDAPSSFSTRKETSPSEPMRSILLADDEPLFGETTARFLRMQNYRVQYVPDGKTAAEALENQKFDLVIADLDMPGNRDLELLTSCRRKFPSTPFLIVTGRPTIPSAIEGIRLGIHDYFLKPFELDDLNHSIQRALPSPRPQTPTDLHFPEILGGGSAVSELKRWLGQISTSNATVLIRGESGTGKELLARAIHKTSQRSEGPYITIDCTSIPESLLESTLFGHVKGAFTGAVQDKSGLIASASGGTLFLDEIGELPMTMQSKLLRVLQFGTFVPVGGTDERKVDVRILAATHRDLAVEVERGTFRLDLYYRLSVLEVVSPPLRDRLEDIALLSRFFLDNISERDNRPRFELTDDAVEFLKSHSWPGNIRELQNAMERTVCTAQGQQLTSADFEAIVSRTAPTAGPLVANTTEVSYMANPIEADSWQDQQAKSEKRYLEGLLLKHRGNVSQAAREAGITRQGLHKAIGRLGLDINQFRSR